MILPWVPETFLARFPRRSWLRPTAEAVSAFYSANTENSHRRREKPLVPRVE